MNLSPESECAMFPFVIWRAVEDALIDSTIVAYNKYTKYIALDDGTIVDLAMISLSPFASVTVFPQFNELDGLVGVKVDGVYLRADIRPGGWRWSGIPTRITDVCITSSRAEELLLRVEVPDLDQYDHVDKSVLAAGLGRISGERLITLARTDALDVL